MKIIINTLLSIDCSFNIFAGREEIEIMHLLLINYYTTLQLIFE